MANNYTDAEILRYSNNLKPEQRLKALNASEMASDKWMFKELTIIKDCRAV